MENHFSRIGDLICSLEAGMMVDAGAIAELLNREFWEMILKLSSAWRENSPGAFYLLEFHREECARLLMKVNAMHGLFLGFAALREGREDLPEVFQLLIDHLNLQSVRMDKLITQAAELPVNDINLN